MLVGQQALIRDLLTALFAGGHVLIEGLPGLGKTALARSMASLLGLRGARVQCTPDLLPADISGAEVLEAGGGSRIRRRRSSRKRAACRSIRVHRSAP